jgi:hypothetical protein
LFTIMTKDHPAFVDPTTDIARDFPRQLSQETIHAYYRRFRDTCYLKCVFLSETPSDSKLINAFIQGCTHADYLKMRAHYDRTDPSKAAWFSFGQLPMTLSQYLDDTDSPVNNSSCSSSQAKDGTSTNTQSSYPPRTNPSSYPARTNHNGTASYPPRTSYAKRYPVRELTHDSNFPPWLDECSPSQLDDSSLAHIQQVQSSRTSNITNCCICGAECGPSRQFNMSSFEAPRFCFSRGCQFRPHDSSYAKRCQ